MLPLITLLASRCSGTNLIPSIYRNLQNTETCEVKIDQLSDITVLIGNVIEILMTLAAFVSVGFIIYGGVRYIVSSGDASGIKSAKETIVNAVIGLVISMLAFGIVRYISGGFA